MRFVKNWSSHGSHTRSRSKVARIFRKVTPPSSSVTRNAIGAASGQVITTGWYECRRAFSWDSDSAKCLMKTVGMFCHRNTVVIYLISPNWRKYTNSVSPIIGLIRQWRHGERWREPWTVLITLVRWALGPSRYTNVFDESKINRIRWIAMFWTEYNDTLKKKKKIILFF